MRQARPVQRRRPLLLGLFTEAREDARIRAVRPQRIGARRLESALAGLRRPLAEGLLLHQPRLERGDEGLDDAGRAVDRLGPRERVRTELLALLLDADADLLQGLPHHAGHLHLRDLRLVGDREVECLALPLLDLQKSRDERLSELTSRTRLKPGECRRERVRLHDFRGDHF